MEHTVNRQSILQELRATPLFDLLIIGGGATGTGIAVDAASRGLKVALVDKQDFAEGTSSRSTKLVHGGVRYLEAAVKKLDKDQFYLVKEALAERGMFLENAPHLAYSRALVTPVYNWFEVPYIYAGLLLYDLLSGRHRLGRSTLVGRKEALRRFPMLKAEGLKAGVIYYDGQFNDARMAVTLAMTAREKGAVVINHAELTGFEKQGGKLCGASIRDSLSGEVIHIKAKGVINATGPFVDRLRQLDDPEADTILEASSGIHIILPKRFVPPDSGLLIPKTEDGRVLFILPWQGHALVGTTDAPADITEHPRAGKEEIEYLIRHINQYFDVKVKSSDVLAAWSGLRPLVHFKDTADTSQIVREHTIVNSDSGLLTIAGGKWTSYRRMAEEVVDAAVKSFALRTDRGCQTRALRLVGAEQFKPENHVVLAKTFGLEMDVAEHLNRAYGDRASLIGEMAKTGLGKRLCENHPYIEAEVVYVMRHEFAERAIDVLARRLSLALLDRQASMNCLDRVIELMAAERQWTSAHAQAEKAYCVTRLEEGL